MHTTRLFSGLPYLPFPKDYPEYVGAKLVAQYYKDYVRALDLPAYPGRECVEAYKLESGAWQVSFANGEDTVARELVFAVGIGERVPVLPDIPGMVSRARSCMVRGHGMLAIYLLRTASPLSFTHSFRWSS